MERNIDRTKSETPPHQNPTDTTHNDIWSGWDRMFRVLACGARRMHTHNTVRCPPAAPGKSAASVTPPPPLWPPCSAAGRHSASARRRINVLAAAGRPALARAQRGWHAACVCGGPRSAVRCAMQPPHAAARRHTPILRVHAGTPPPSLRRLPRAASCCATSSVSLTQMPKPYMVLPCLLRA